MVSAGWLLLSAVFWSLWFPATPANNRLNTMIKSFFIFRFPRFLLAGSGRRSFQASMERTLTWEKTCRASLTTGDTGNTEVTAGNEDYRGKPRLRRMLANGDAACLVFADLPGEGGAIGELSTRRTLPRFALTLPVFQWAMRP